MGRRVGYKSVGRTGLPMTFLKKTFISVSDLDQLESGSFKIEVKAVAMVDVHGYVYYT